MKNADKQTEKSSEKKKNRKRKKKLELEKARYNSRKSPENQVCVKKMD